MSAPNRDELRAQLKSELTILAVRWREMLGSTTDEGEAFFLAATRACMDAGAGRFWEFGEGLMKSPQTLADLHNKGYRLKHISGLNRKGGKAEPVGVGLFEKAGEYFESVIYERFGDWLYATPERLVR